MNATLRIGLAVTAGAIAAGCVSPSAPPASPGASPAPSAVPSSLPSDPAREPGDKPPATGWVSGVVTRGGTGPCYGFTADDGTRYALYNTSGLELTQRDRVKVQLETTMIRIYCGPGHLMAMTAAEPIT
ncbi:hypothetical protein AB0C07_20290 [Actinoplanes missouriensis]|uniref:hypothetical protein n=1 Tax=Actinoplanes missouriensis TaxID=1866 RepID=UPI0033EF7070